MVIAAKGFNTYLRMTLMLALFAGCQSPEKRASNRLSTLNVHLETTHELPDHEQVVSVSREHPFTLNVQKSPFLTQNDIEQASVVDAVGGFALRLQFDHQGTWLLEQSSAGNIGKHFAIFSQFANPLDEKHDEARWLAAPRINHRIHDGVLIFTPDASREEAEQIAQGLNNLAKKLKKKML